jgi:hypothetical protein
MSRLDRLKEQYPELNITIIDLMAKVDPTDTYKYTEFLLKKLKDWHVGESKEETQLSIGIDIISEENVQYLNEFERHCKAGRIKKNDIGQHKDFNSIILSVKEAEEIVKQKESEKKVIKLMDTPEYCVVIPLSYDASRVYGANTKWCTTQEKYWKEYSPKYKLIYIIDRENNEKYAVSRKKDDDLDIQAWLSNDDEVSPLMLPLPTEVIMLIMSEVKKNESVADLMNEEDKDNDSESYGKTMEYMRSYLNEYNINIPEYLHSVYSHTPAPILNNTDPIGVSLHSPSPNYSELIEQLRRL